MVVRTVTFVICLVLLLASAPMTLAGSRPRPPLIQEPAADGQIVHPADVHMATAPFSDPDGDAHYCTTWIIILKTTGRRVWQDPCDRTGKVHVHLGDGTFVGSYAGRTSLKYGQRYILRVRFAQQRPGGLLWSKWRERRFATSQKPPPGTATAWTVDQAGYEVEVVAGGFRLPVNIAFLPTAPLTSSSPFYYVTELYGSIKVVARDGSVSDYFNGALNYAPPLTIPGAGEQGLTGIVVDPASGDVFASMLHEASDGLNYPRIVRFHSDHGGAVADTSQLVFEVTNESMGPAHQISNLSIGPDGYLYVHMGDGFATASAVNVNKFNGKILRMTLAGAPVPTNPFYDSSDGISAKDYVYAYGFRNPFGGAWRPSDSEHYVAENGPSVDRLSQLVAGRNYLWDGTDTSMANYAIYNWSPSVAPINITFVDSTILGGSGFPATDFGHAFVSESGPTYANGPVGTRGKRITELVLDAAGTSLVSGPTPLVHYTGTGRATVSGLAAGPDGLYFTDLYKDLGATNAGDRGAQVLRIKWVGP